VATGARSRRRGHGPRGDDVPERDLHVLAPGADRARGVAPGDEVAEGVPSTVAVSGPHDDPCSDGGDGEQVERAPPELLGTPFVVHALMVRPHGSA
jgi:hypothetical protein